MVYKTAIYARLSVDHAEEKADPIGIQIDFLRAFIRSHNAAADSADELVLYDIYADLGKTGTNFERAGFKRMMREVRTGSVQCILVKDLSRFGRNYIETGNYLEKILPFMGVRVISVCDHYDSFAEGAHRQELSMHIKNLVNEAYAKDISVKWQAAKRAAQKNGIYVGAAAPYGYRLEKRDGGCQLMKEPEAARIVVRIFEEYVSGRSIQHIIDALFGAGVHRISDYNRCHHVFCREGERLYQWSRASVRAVLRRESYCGDLVQRRYASRFQRGEKGCDALDESQWIVVKNTHEPIISRDVFVRAQSRLQAAGQVADRVGWKAADRTFYKVLFCGECGRRLCTGRSKGKVFYFCGAARYRDERRCSYKSISENKLQRIVRSTLAGQLRSAGLRREDIAVVSGRIFLVRIRELQNKISDQDDHTERYAERLARVFARYKEGEISQETYMKMREEQKYRQASREERKNILEGTVQTLQIQQKEEERFLRDLLEVDGADGINAELAESLIEKIHLYSDSSLKIIVRFMRGAHHEGSEISNRILSTFQGRGSGRRQ